MENGRTITLLNTVVDHNKIKYDFTYGQELREMFSTVPFFVEYDDDMDLCDIPISILNIPFVANILPLCFFFDCTLNIESIDESFYKSIPDIKIGFQEIYKEFRFGGKIESEQIVKNDFVVKNTVACLFTGGIDATYTLLRHKEEKPIIVNVWGVDVALDDIKGHSFTESYIKSVADYFDLKYFCVKSSLRKMFDEHFLSVKLLDLVGDHWWHGAQHSIGLLSLLAPYDYKFGIKTNYIAASFTQKEYLSGVKCISYPVVDNMMRIGNSTCVHDGFESERIEKTKVICEYVKKTSANLSLKVCFYPSNGRNCCSCEKCFRTILSILIFDKNITAYGFEEKDYSKIIRKYLDVNEIGVFRWEPIQEAYRLNDLNKDISWLRNYKFNNMSSLKARLNRIVRKIKKIR